MQINRKYPLILIACLFVFRLMMPASGTFAPLAPPLRYTITPAPNNAARINALLEAGNFFPLKQGELKPDMGSAALCFKNAQQPAIHAGELLLKEILRSVKNNLHTVMSPLNSQGANLQNDAALVDIRDSQHRVQAISLIHKKLYQSDNVEVGYIHELVDYLDGGEIQIAFENMGGDTFALRVTDNGIGLPPDFELYPAGITSAAESNITIPYKSLSTCLPNLTWHISSHTI